MAACDRELVAAWIELAVRGRDMVNNCVYRSSSRRRPSHCQAINCILPYLIARLAWLESKRVCEFAPRKIRWAKHRYFHYLSAQQEGVEYSHQREAEMVLHLSKRESLYLCIIDTPFLSIIHVK